MLKKIENIPAHVKLPERPSSPMEILRASGNNLLEMFPAAVLSAPFISRPYNSNFHFVMQPAALKHILLDNVENYPKSQVMTEISRSVAADTIIADHGKNWRKARKGIMPSFRPANLRNYSAAFTKAAEDLVGRMSPKSGGTIEVSAEMTETAHQVISDVVINGCTTFNSNSTRRALTAFQNETARISLLDFMNAPSWIPRPSRMMVSPSITHWKKQVDHAIALRKAVSNPQSHDMLQDMLDLQSADDTGFWTDSRIRDNVTTMMIAGHETTSNTMAWALYLCAFDPEIQEAASAQARQVLGGRTATIDDLETMPLVTQIIKETMRLYPALTLLTRKAVADDIVNGVQIRRNDTIVMPLYALHRHKMLWENPDEFDPSRFDGTVKYDKFQYLPFGAGPRICIGAQFALLEAPIILATLLSKFRFSLAMGRTPRPMLKITLSSQNGIHLGVHAR